jgi:hypothetical protein
MRCIMKPTMINSAETPRAIQAPGSRHMASSPGALAEGHQLRQLGLGRA